MRTGRLEVDCEPVMVALELLPKVDHVNEVNLHGSLLHVVVDGLSPDDLAGILGRMGSRVNSVRVIKPSLEDVFVSRIHAGQTSPAIS